MKEKKAKWSLSTDHWSYFKVNVHACFLLASHIAVALDLGLRSAIVAAPHDAHAEHGVPKVGRRVRIDAHVEKLNPIMFRRNAKRFAHPANDAETLVVSFMTLI